MNVYELDEMAQFNQSNVSIPQSVISLRRGAALNVHSAATPGSEYGDLEESAVTKLPSIKNNNN